MAKIIRLTESELTSLVKRIIKESNVNLYESTLSTDQIKLASSKIMSCFDSKKYPNLSKASNGSLQVVFGLVLMWAGITGEIFSFGIATIPAVMVTSAGLVKNSLGIKRIYDANISKIGGELKELYNCLFG